MARKEILRTYHGLPKSVTDEHTVFYCSFDGSMEPEIDKIGLTFSSISGSEPSPTSLGSSFIAYKKDYLLNSSDILTFDGWVDMSKMRSLEDGRSIFGLHTVCSLSVASPTRVQIHNGKTFSYSSASLSGYTHFRLIVRSEYLKLYINGKLAHQEVLTTFDTKSTNLVISGYASLGSISKTLGYFSDLHISNIDRGDIFPNLPQDFIEGRAVVQPRFGQQQVFSDKAIMQRCEVTIPHPKGTDDPRFIKDSQGRYIGYKEYPEISFLYLFGSTTGGYGSVTIKSYADTFVSGYSQDVKLQPPEITAIGGGAIFTGDWSGVGTSQCSFNFQSFAHGMDVKIVYAINIPSGNSAFKDKVPTKLVSATDFLGRPITDVVFDPVYRSITRSTFSKEPFVTETEVLVNPVLNSTSKTVKVIKEVSDFFVTDVGNNTELTGSPFNHVLHRLQSNDNTLTCTVGYATLPIDILGKNANLGREITINSTQIVTGNTQESIPTSLLGRTSGILRYLVEDQGELKLLLHVTPTTEGIKSNKTSGKVFLIPLENRPLVK